MTPFDKAIIGGITATLLAEAARYGFQPTPQDVTTLGVILTALVPYVITHAAIYFKNNKKGL